MISVPSLHEILISLQGLNKHPDADLQLRRHILATIKWIMHAHQVVGDGGISKGYSLLRGRWAPSYPETTAYTIPTLLNAAELLQRSDLRSLAFSLADYLLTKRDPEGGLSHYKVSPRSKPVVFDTGQAIFGWLAAYVVSGDQRYLQAAVRSGNWLVEVQHSSGSWREYQHHNVVKVIDTRVSWALLELHRQTQLDEYYEAAIRNLDWALHQQDSSGWFRRCSLIEGEDPLTHTLGYTAEGLFESGRLLNDPRCMVAAKLIVDALLTKQRANGSLAATYGPAWQETSRSSCLTGNCQIAHLWLRFFMMNGYPAYYEAAVKAIHFVARTQNLHTSDVNIHGAIAGSYPIYGRYERFKYPNWAAKFFVDALIALESAMNGKRSFAYVG